MIHTGKAAQETVPLEGAAGGSRGDDALLEQDCCEGHGNYSCGLAAVQLQESFQVLQGWWSRGMVGVILHGS